MNQLFRLCMVVSFFALTACQSFTIQGSTTASPTPTPTATPGATATPTPSSSSTPTPTATPTPSASIATSGMVVHLEASQASGSAPYATGCSAGNTTWHDLASTNNATLTFTGSCIATSAWQGANSTASPSNLYFDNTFNLAQISAAASINDLTTSTFTLWIKRANTNPGALLYKSDNNNSAGWFFFVNTPGIGFSAVTTGVDLARTTSTSVGVNVWTHVAATWDGTLVHTGAHIYVNGTEVTYDSQDVSGTGSHNTDAAQVIKIGNGNNGTGGYFEGAVGGVILYNRVLSLTEIKSNCQAQQANYSSSSCAP